MRHVCFCNCHVAPDDMRAFADAGVDVRNVLEAAIACGGCQKSHSPALLNTSLANECVVPRRGVTVITPEGKKLAWDDYEREMNKRNGQ